MTGTGSGKTESFLLPILGKFAREASECPQSFAQPAMRALLLYPMNALVNDQLGRLRAIFDLRPASILRDLDLRRPIYLPTAAYGHFGREDFSWERLDRLEALRSAMV